HERDGHRADRGGLRGGRHRRPGQHAGRLRGRAGGGRAAIGRHLGLPRARDAAHLPDRDRRADPTPTGTVRAGRAVKGRIGVVTAAAAIVLLPRVVSEYHVTLMLPFMAYAIVLLGLNLLFGYTGLVSFGHALFVGIGAYTAAVLTTHAGIRSLELMLL